MIITQCDCRKMAELQCVPPEYNTCGSGPSTLTYLLSKFEQPKDMKSEEKVCKGKAGFNKKVRDLCTRAEYSRKIRFQEFANETVSHHERLGFEQCSCEYLNASIFLRCERLVVTAHVD